MLKIGYQLNKKAEPVTIHKTVAAFVSRISKYNLKLSCPAAMSSIRSVSVHTKNITKSDVVPSAGAEITRKRQLIKLLKYTQWSAFSSSKEFLEAVRPG